jgi:hypothetical protein
MRARNAETVNHLLSNKEFISRIIVTIFADATTIRLSSADDITFEGDDYLAASEAGGAPGFEHGEITNALGMEVQNTSLTIYHGQHCKVDLIGWPAFVRMGGLDNARVRIERLVWVPALGGWDSLMLFYGIIGSKTQDAMKTVVEVESFTRVFDRTFPRNRYSAGCVKSFGSPSCGMNRAALTHHVTALAGSDRATLYTGITSQAEGYFVGGTLTHGGVRREIATSMAAGVLALAVPLPSAPAAGDALVVAPACARTRVACEAWGNSARFLAMPHIPRPETSL